jgi:hypothetical protein
MDPNTIFQWKFLESTVVASWAFLFLIAPMLAAYGLVEGVAWSFYPMTLLMILMFVILPGFAGAWAAIGLARYMDRRQFQYSLLAIGVLTLGALAFWLKTEQITDDMLETRVMLVLDRLLKNTQFSQFAFLPSYWLASGVIAWSEGATSSTFFFILVLLSYGLFFGGLTMTCQGIPFMRLPLLSRVAAQVWGGGSGIAGEKLQTTHWPRLSGNRAGFIAACSFCFGFLRTDVRFWSRMLGSFGAIPVNGAKACCFLVCWQPT